MTFMPVHGACPVCHRDNTLTATPSGGIEDSELAALRAEVEELKSQVRNRDNALETRAITLREVQSALMRETTAREKAERKLAKANRSANEWATEAARVKAEFSKIVESHTDLLHQLQSAIDSGEESERKLAELQEAFTLRTQLRNRTLEQLEEKKHECLELRSKLATAKRNALEQAANACQDDESGRDGGGYFAEIIRALMKEGGE